MGLGPARGRRSGGHGSRRRPGDRYLGRRKLSRQLWLTSCLTRFFFFFFSEKLEARGSGSGVCKETHSCVSQRQAQSAIRNLRHSSHERPQVLELRGVPLGPASCCTATGGSWDLACGRFFSSSAFGTGLTSHTTTTPSYLCSQRRRARADSAVGYHTTARGLAIPQELVGPEPSWRGGKRALFLSSTQPLKSVWPCNFPMLPPGPCSSNPRPITYLRPRNGSAFPRACAQQPKAPVASQSGRRRPTGNIPTAADCELLHHPPCLSGRLHPGATASTTSIVLSNIPDLEGAVAPGPLLEITDENPCPITESPSYTCY